MDKLKLPKLRKIDPSKPRRKKPKILLLSDDLRMPSGIGVMSREFVMGTVDKYDWVQLGAAVKHPDHGKIMDASDDMIANWLGYGSMLGFRYYLTTRMALDFKSGFMNNRYNEKNWYLRNKKVTGPKLKIDGLPIFSLKILYALR